MQRNSTSTIIRRLASVLAFVGLAHLIARLTWHFQVFGVNVPPKRVCVPADLTPEPWFDGRWYHYGPRFSCSTGVKSTFWEYTGDWWPFFGTHVMGIAAAFLIFVLITWIVFRDPKDITCQIEDCPCHSHKSQVFEDGEWKIPFCPVGNCKCVEH